MLIEIFQGIVGRHILLSLNRWWKTNPQSYPIPMARGLSWNMPRVIVLLASTAKRKLRPGSMAADNLKSPHTTQIDSTAVKVCVFCDSDVWGTLAALLPPWRGSYQASQESMIDLILSKGFRLGH